MANTKSQERRLVRQLIGWSLFFVTASALFGQYKMGNLTTIANGLYDRFQPSFSKAINVGRKTMGDYQAAGEMLLNTPMNIANVKKINKERHAQLEEVMGATGGTPVRTNYDGNKSGLYATIDL